MAFDRGLGIPVEEIRHDVHEPVVCLAIVAPVVALRVVHGSCGLPLVGDVHGFAILDEQIGEGMIDPVAVEKRSLRGFHAADAVDPGISGAAHDGCHVVRVQDVVVDDGAVRIDIAAIQLAEGESID